MFAKVQEMGCSLEEWDGTCWSATNTPSKILCTRHGISDNGNSYDYRSQCATDSARDIGEMETNIGFRCCHD